LLVFAGSRAGASRPSLEYSGAAPSSSASADYAVDLDAPVLSPLDVEVVMAAMQDREELGMPAQDLASPPRLGSPSATNVGEGTDPAAVSGEKVSSPQAVSPPAPIELARPGSHSSIPVVPILVAVLAVGGVTLAAYYLMRPRES
jgi:hypothetical protein